MRLGQTQTSSSEAHTSRELSKVERRYQRLKRKVENQLQALQQQRDQQLAPTRLYLPIPWQPNIYEQPVVMFKVLAAQGGQFTSVYDSRVVYPLQQWTYARSGCSSSDNNSSSWPPLWSCLYAYPSANRARSAAFPRGSQQQKGARVLCQVTVQGKGYQHPADGKVAVSRIRLDRVLEYVPKGPSECVVSVNYDAVSLSAAAEGGASAMFGGRSRGADERVRGSGGGGGVGGVGSRMRVQQQSPPPMRLVAALQEAAWDADADE